MGQASQTTTGQNVWEGSRLNLVARNNGESNELNWLGLDLGLGGGGWNWYTCKSIVGQFDTRYRWVGTISPQIKAGNILH